jgi:hypothetical protein
MAAACVATAKPQRRHVEEKRATSAAPEDARAMILERTSAGRAPSPSERRVLLRQ